MKKLYFLLFILSLSNVSKATHIFGGDFSMVRLPVQGNRFKVGLTIYIDEKNASVASRARLTGYQTVAIYRKKDNVLIESFIINENPRETVVYDECGNSLGVQTTKYFFSVERNFDPNLYKDQGGYYLTWQDCCRNSTIVNAVSSGNNAGMTFYLEFPAMLDTSNKPFINSSPQFNFVDGQIICVNENATIDFGANDEDGDQLEFRLVTPYSNYAGSNNNKDVVPSGIRTGSEYPFLTWRGGYSENNMIPGNPALQIDPKTGKMTVNASQIGIAYVICVEVREYRNGKLIGLVKRDYQFQVTNCLPPPLPPKVYLPTSTAAVRDLGIKKIDFCEEGFVILNTRDSSIYAYQWSKNGKDLIGETKSSIKIREVGKYIVSIAYRGLCSKKNESEIITVVDKPGEDLVLKSDQPVPICAEKKLNLLVNKTGVNYRYTWTLDGDTLKNFKTPTIPVNKSGTYQVIITNVASDCQFDPSINVVINPTPQVKLTNVKNILVACDGDTIPLKAKEVAGLNYQFFQGSLSVANSKSPNFDAKKTGVYHYIASDANGCVNTSDSVKLLVNPSPVPTMDSIPTQCGASSRRLNLNGRPLGGIYLGKAIEQNGIFDSVVSGFGLFKIVYTVTNEYKCTRLASRFINIAQTPRVTLGSDLSIVRGDTVRLRGSVSAGASLYWNPPLGLDNPSVINPLASPFNTTTYILKALYANGCAAEGDVVVTVYPNLKVPSGITPNDDGINDIWEIEGINELPDAEVEIYSRWGEKVFTSKGYDKPFDGKNNGKELPMATYYYVIKPNNGGNHFKGTLTILK